MSIDELGLDAVAALSRHHWSPPTPDPFPILRATYLEMLSKNVPGVDQFFHCMGTCRARKNGSTPTDIRAYTDAKEYFRDYPLGRLGLYGSGGRLSHQDMMNDIRGDQAANEQGMSCPANVPCNQRCSPLLDNLPPKYRPFMQKYRTVW
jgi:hypothetical protein